MQQEIVTHFSVPTAPSLGHTEKLIGSSLFFSLFSCTSKQLWPWYRSELSLYWEGIFLLYIYSMSLFSASYK